MNKIKSMFKKLINKWIEGNQIMYGNYCIYR